ncbi:VOC family protein [Haliangium ochraceum]|uniref:Glyoxalase/bleomycin resistance protein/dioxygenase n=1 Tax=Haliangium ochraceum (strain DSM 14365 / JCM 11303 / SMP-2) TaxID=502025 RepID=D0LLT6_HALO1|nr:VOC family protein [Haliangium ochraceum]ACY15114.1 Glyoxalase/bleomycin resistance protein/dioxygenase [Haliangium ochraceum DSM 14365]
MNIHEVFAYLRVDDTAGAIEFYQQAFGATEKFRLTEPSGRIGHAELSLGPATLMLSDEYPEYGILGPKSIGGTAASIHLHVDDCDAMIARAVELGGELLRAPQDAFYGERSGKVRDPFGHEWLIGHSIEDVTPEEMQRRYTAMFDES